MPDIIYKDNDNLLVLEELKNSATGSYLNTATVTLTAIRDAAGAVVSGETFPKTMSYVVASNGKYQASVDKAIAIVVGRQYTAIIDATATGIDGHWEIPLVARVRTS